MISTAITTLTLCLMGLYPTGNMLPSNAPVQRSADQNGPVQIEYICTGPRESIFSDESNEGVWLRLTNNSRRTLFIRTYPKPKTKDSCARKAKQEVGIYYEVVEKKGYASAEREITELPADRPIPGTGVVVKVKRGKSIIFSVAREHLAANRAIYVTFWYGQTETRQKIEELSRAYFYAFELPDRTARIVNRRNR